MTLHPVDRSQWAGFCEYLDRELVGKRAEIEVGSAQFGVQVEARWLPILGVAYDARNDVFVITLDGLDHMIFHPLELYAEVGSCGLESLAVFDSQAWQIVLVREPLMLPPPKDL